MALTGQLYLKNRICNYNYKHKHIMLDPKWPNCSTQPKKTEYVNIII